MAAGAVVVPAEGEPTESAGAAAVSPIVDSDNRGISGYPHINYNAVCEMGKETQNEHSDQTKQKEYEPYRFQCCYNTRYITTNKNKK